MSNQNCNCDDLTVNQATEQTPQSVNWIAERPVKTAELPETVAENMSRFYGESHTRGDYERWSEDVAATTIGIPLEAGVPIAAALTATSLSEVAE